MKQVEGNVYIVSTVGTDGLVILHQGIGSPNAEYASMRFQMLMG